MPKIDKLPVINQRLSTGESGGAVVVVTTTAPSETDPNDAGRPTGHQGTQYFGPTVYLVEDLAVDALTMRVTAALFVGDESCYISSTSGYEKIWLVGTAVASGNWWSYPIERAKGYTSAVAHPSYAEVISIGSPSTGGYILVDSARDAESPFIEMRQNNADRSTTWRLQLGRLTSVPDWFKAYFPKQTAEDWAKFSLAGDNLYMSGNIRATGGTISGDLTVTGTLFVPYDDGKPMLEFGQTIDGAGMVLRDDQGAPRFMIVTPYVDEHGNESDLAMVLAHRGKMGLYWHYSAAIDDYVLELQNATVGPFEVNEAQVIFSESFYNDLYVAALSMEDGATPPGLTQFKDDGAASTGVFALNFDKDTEEERLFSIHLPHSYKQHTDITPQVHWAPTDTDTGAVVWGLEYTWFNVDGTAGNTTIITATDAADGTADKHQRADFAAIAGWGMTPGSQLLGRVFRKAADGADTYDADAALFGVAFHIEQDRFGASE